MYRSENFSRKETRREYVNRIYPHLIAFAQYQEIENFNHALSMALAQDPSLEEDLIIPLGKYAVTELLTQHDAEGTNLKKAKVILNNPQVKKYLHSHAWRCGIENISLWDYAQMNRASENDLLFLAKEDYLPITPRGNDYIKKAIP